MQSKILKLPTSTTASGGRRERGDLHVLPAGKPPKLRWRPGTKVRYQGAEYQIMYCYRVQEDPQEWHIELEALREPDDMARALAALGAGSTTPRVVYEIFRSGMDAHQYFADIPANGDRTVVTNRLMLQHAEVIP